MCRGYERKYFLDLAKHRLTAYTVYCSIPSKDRKKPIHKWLPLPIDEGSEKVDIKELKSSWERLKQLETKKNME